MALGFVFLFIPALEETGKVLLTGVGMLCLNRAKSETKEDIEDKK